ncbi:putative Plasma membrane fusion protein prm1 [Diplocarpon rosae]|nr:putative Plasma membrane fusion protein prm1 [Diplocarpon rosae]
MLPLAGLRRLLASATEMSFARHQPQGFPTVPSTLNAGSSELRDWPPSYSPPPNTDPYYTPYLGLRARLSQVWINRWTVLLLLIVCRLLLATRGLNGDLASAKTEAMSACSSVEQVGSAMASMPHYLAGGVNALAADGFTSAVNAMMSMLLMSITAVEEIVLFVIHMMTSTYLCLITLTVAGSLHVALELIEKVGDFMNKTIADITGGISGEVADFQTSFNSFLSAINIGGIFGSESDPPKINLTSAIDKLNSIQIPTDTLDGDLVKLNASIPSFDQVQNATDAVIRLPFEEVKKLINGSLVAYKFDKSVFPVPQKEQLSFCTDSPAIDDFFGGLVKTVELSKNIFLAVLIVLAILVCVPMAFREIWRWRSMRTRASMLQKTAFDPIDVVYIASRPYSTTAGISLAEKFSSPKRKILIRWFVAYATTLPALFVLSLGLAGLFTCLCQYIILKAVERKVPELAAEVGDFSGMVVNAVNNASKAWSVSANQVINSTNKDINDDVFGWVNITTSAVNGTLNTFTDEMGSALNTTFGGTILYDPIKEVLNCLIGLKIAGIQKGLTWVSDHAHVDFPLFKPDVFSLEGLSEAASNSSSTDAFFASPENETTDTITAVVVKVATKMGAAIKEEMLISFALIGVYLFIVLVGLARVIYGVFIVRDKTRGEGGPSFTGDSRQPLSPRTPTRNSNPFPAFGAPASSIYPTQSNGDLWPNAVLHDEKAGVVGHRNVEVSVKPGHERQSSYGFMDGDADRKF